MLKTSKLCAHISLASSLLRSLTQSIFMIAMRMIIPSWSHLVRAQSKQLLRMPVNLTIIIKEAFALTSLPLRCLDSDDQILIQKCCKNGYALILQYLSFVELTHLPLVPHIALIQIMACHLFGAKPLPEPMLAYHYLDSWERISVKSKSEFYHFHWRKCIWNCRLPKWRPFCPGGDELNYTC